MNSARLSVTVCFLLIAAGFAGWYYAKPSMIINPSRQTSLPDTIIKNMIATVFDEHGKPTQILATPELLHYPEDDSSVFSEPRITIFRESNEPLHIQSAHGHSNDGADKITLWENVILHQPGSIDNPESTITTSELTHYSQQQIAETDKPVMLAQADLIVESIGMRAYLDTEVIDLLTAVRGRYEKTE